MNKRHLDAFLDAIHRLDIVAAAAYIDDAIVVRNPLFPEPIMGKAAVIPVLTHVLAIADRYEVVDTLRSETHFAVVHRFIFGDVEIEGVDYIHLNDAGLIDALTVMWRPLPAVVAVQALVAPVLGAPVLKLVQA